jgi:DinB superfamily
MQYMKLTEIQQLELMEELAGMNKFLHDEFDSLTPEEARTPGPGGSFSPVEHVWHLADLEREAFGVRIQRLQTQANPHLPDFDGTKIAKERGYRSLSLPEGLRAFEVARKANIDVFHALPPDAWFRSGTQEGVGAVSLCDMPTFLRQHDEAHIAEIEEWKHFVGRSGDA